jgi:hypothetical protein
MISRSELEGLIVEGLGEIRRAESRLNRRFKRLTCSKTPGRAGFLYSLAELEARAARVQAMVNALDRYTDFARPEAA